MALNFEKLAAAHADELIRQYLPILRKRLAEGLMKAVAEEVSSAADGDSPKKAKKGRKAKKTAAAAPAEKKARAKKTSSADVVAAVKTLVTSWTPETRIAISEIEKATGIDKQVLHRALKALITEGTIVRVGEKRFSRYALPGAENAPTAAPTEPPVSGTADAGSNAALVVVTLRNHASEKKVNVLWTIRPKALARSAESPLAFVIEWEGHGRMLFWLDSGLPVAKQCAWRVDETDLEIVKQYFGETPKKLMRGQKRPQTRLPGT